jgi:hypothetical protein
MVREGEGERDGKRGDGAKIREMARGARVKETE